MSLGADDAQTSGGKYALSLVLADLLCLPACLGTLLVGDFVGGDALGNKKVVGHDLSITAEQDVGTTTGHVGCDGHRTLTTGLRHDLGLALMELRVEHAVTDATLGEQPRDLLGILDRDSTHQTRLALGMALLDVFCYGVELGLDVAVHKVVVVFANNRAIGRNDLHGQVVDLAELSVLGHGRTGHAAELVVQTEVVLERDGGERLVLLANEHAFLGLDGLM